MDRNRPLPPSRFLSFPLCIPERTDCHVALAAVWQAGCVRAKHLAVFLSSTLAVPPVTYVSSACPRHSPLTVLAPTDQ